MAWAIGRLATYWEKHNVTLIEESESFFYGKDGLPTSRYFANDGVHLSNPGVKRLLHAIDSKVHIVANFDLCIYQSRRSSNGTDYASRRSVTPPMTGSSRRLFGPTTYNRNSNPHRDTYRGERGNTCNSNNGRTKRRCFACGMVGRVQKDYSNTV